MKKRSRTFDRSATELSLSCEVIGRLSVLSEDFAVRDAEVKESLGGPRTVSSGSIVFCQSKWRNRLW